MPITARDLCLASGVFVLLACCLISVGCAGGVSSNSTHNNLSISGTVSPAQNGSGATLTLGGAASATTTADTSGNYNFTGLADGSYTVTPTKNGFNFSPASQSATVSLADVTGVNFNIQSQAATVNIYPGTDIPSVVSSSPAGTAFVIYPGTYRLTKSIIPKNGDSFVGQTTCAPPATSCPAIISGSTVIGPLASFDGTNYEVTNQTQQNPTGPTAYCDPGWEACIYPEDLYFDGIPYQHLSSSTLPAIGPGQWWFDYTNHIIYFHDNPSGHTVETSVLNNAFGGPANNVTIQYLTLEEFADMFPTGTIGVSQGDNPQTQSANWTVENCEVLLNHGFGVRVGYGIQILNNYLHNNGQAGVGGGIGVTSAPSTQSINSGILIQGNIITHNDYAHFDPNFGSGGIKIGSTSGVTIRGNTIQNNEGSGVHFDDYCENELLDGNTITDNFDSDGVNQEIGYGTSTFRNNIVLRNGAQVYESHYTDQIAAHASTGVNAYCNVLEISKGTGINGWSIGAADRGSSAYPPYQYLATTGNSFHHNTVFWDAGAAGGVGFIQDDATNQPNFFADNTPPDYNTYHLPSTSDTYFMYDNNNSQNNAAITFADYQAAGADVHGAADTNYTSGFPTVAITSPLDQSSFTGSVPVTATASDASGIGQVEFYLDWDLQSTVTSAPYNFTLTGGAAGPHTITAMAYSNAGIRACYAITLNQQ
jgi:parallel beta-helix repeat protein